MKVGDLVRWLDPWKNKRIGLIVAALGIERAHDIVGASYYDVLIDGKTEFCHRNNLEVINESR